MIGNSILADTNIFIDLMKGETAKAIKLETFAAVYITPIILAELYFGAHRTANPSKHLNSIAFTLKNVRLLITDAETAELFVSIKLALFNQGKPIPENDIWIAASALQHQLPVYSSDKHFAQVDGITIV